MKTTLRCVSDCVNTVISAQIPAQDCLLSPSQMNAAMHLHHINQSLWCKCFRGRGKYRVNENWEDSHRSTTTTYNTKLFAMSLSQLLLRCDVECCGGELRLFSSMFIASLSKYLWLFWICKIVKSLIQWIYFSCKKTFSDLTKQEKHIINIMDWTLTVNRRHLPFSFFCFLMPPVSAVISVS